MSKISEKGTAVVTGASSGIGAVYADRLAKRGYDLILVARNADRLASLSNRLTAETGRTVETIKADLNDKSDLAAIERRLKSDQSITLLVNNAGVGSGASGASGARRETSADGFELRFAVNYLAGFLLTHLLLPNLKAAAPARIVNVASLGQRAAELRRYL